MRSYTFHPPADARPGEPHGLERAVLVPDGFSWTAFVFGALWFLYHRLWIAALVVIAGLAAALVAGWLLGLAPGAITVVLLLLHLLIGLEASSLRRWTLQRSGRPARDAFLAANATEAEMKALARWLDPDRTPPVPVAPPSATARAAGPIVGLYPFGEGGR